MDFMKLNPPFTKEFLKTDFSKYVREDCEINWYIDKNELDESKMSSKKILSAEFPKDNNSNFKWQIDFRLFGEIKEEIKYASIFLHLNWRRIQIPVLTAALFSVKGNSNSVIKEQYMQHKYERKEGRGYREFIDSSKLKSYMFEESLLISVKVSAQYEVSKFSFEQNLLDNYSSLLDDDIFSDMILYVEQDKNEFKVHRSILARRSKVFASMFGHKMQENLSRRVVISDFPSSAVKKLLNFIYSCKTEFINVDETLTLLEISDKYDVTDLKNQCAEYLVRNLDANNALDILLKSDLYNLLDLKNAALAYIHENKKLFSDPDKYHILKKYPELIVEIVTKFINSSE